MISLREGRFCGKVGIESHSQVLDGHDASRKNSGEEKGPSQGIILKCEPQVRDPWAPKFEERTEDETPNQERWCARRDASELAKDVHKLENESKGTFCSPAEAWVMLARSSTKMEDRAFLIDSGASVHMLSKKDLSSGELETLKKALKNKTVVTANGEVQTNEEAQVCVHDLHIFVTVQLLEDILAVLSLGKLCKEHGYTYEWPSAREPLLTENGNQTLCRTENFVPLVVPGLSSSSTTASSSTSPPQDLFLRIQQICEVTKGLRAGKVFPNGWETSLRISRSQKYLHPQKFLMTLFRNVLSKWHHGSTVFF